MSDGAAAYRIEFPLSGVTLRDETGARVVTMTVIRDGGAARIVTVGAWPADVELPREAVDHLAELFGRLSRTLRFPDGLIRTGLPQTTSFWS